MSRRLAALDWMRGIVMVLMAIDHASASYNADRLVTDAYWLYTPGMELPAAQFFTRWISHLCAPTFVFLAGTALALSVLRRRERGVAESTIDRDLLIRGTIILLLDPLFVSFVWRSRLPGEANFMFQVLYAIGLSFLLMIPLRRLGTAWLVGLGTVLLVCNELLAGLVTAIGSSTWVGVLAIHGGFLGSVVVAYPVLPWLGMMMLGWALGRYLTREDAAPVRWMAYVGVGAMVLFLVVRGINGYGNNLLLRDDLSLIQWLHCSKYPPSLSFTALELGLMALMLSALFKIQQTVGERINAYNPLLVFGQTALFFYLLHIPLLQYSADLLGMAHDRGLRATYLATAAVLALLYPLCLWFRAYKAAHHTTWVRFI